MFQAIVHYREHQRARLSSESVPSGRGDLVGSLSLPSSPHLQHQREVSDGYPPPLPNRLRAKFVPISETANPYSSKASTTSSSSSSTESSSSSTGTPSHRPPPRRRRSLLYQVLVSPLRKKSSPTTENSKTVVVAAANHREKTVYDLSEAAQLQQRQIRFFQQQQLALQNRHSREMSATPPPPQRNVPQGHMVPVARVQHVQHFQMTQKQMQPLPPLPPNRRATHGSLTHLGSQRNPAFYQPPASVYDDDPGIMSEVETSATGFRRASKVRSSLPIVRTPSKTQERPLGLVFLQYRSETKRALLPNEITTLDTVKALFVRSFPKQLTMEYLDSNHIRVYIHDPSKDMFYELEDLRDIRDRSVLRIYEQDANGGGVYNSTYDNEMSYFSEPEFDSEYQNQHIHRAKGSKSSVPTPLPQQQSSNYYGIVSPYTAGNRTASLPHGASLRPYSPAPSERPKSQPIPPGYVQTLPRGMHLPSYTPSPPSPPEKRPMDLLTPPGVGQPPPKPQRSFQQSVPPMSKGMRSTPPPSGPPPSIPSPRSGQPRTLERRHEPQGAYRTTPERPYSAGPGYHTSPERRYEVSYHSSPERRTHDSGYLSSPERRLDHQRAPFPGYSSSYDDSFYSGAPERMYGSRSGSVTPVIDEEARLRVEFMERQLASLTGLVQKALAAGTNTHTSSTKQLTLPPRPPRASLPAPGPPLTPTETIYEGVVLRNIRSFPPTPI